MKIENLDRAVSLSNELDELNKMLTLLNDNNCPMVTVNSNTNRNSESENTWDKEVCNGLKKVIAKRICELEKEVKTL